MKSSPKSIFVPVSNSYACYDLNIHACYDCVHVMIDTFTTTPSLQYLHYCPWIYKPFPTFIKSVSIMWSISLPISTNFVCCDVYNAQWKYNVPRNNTSIIVTNFIWHFSILKKYMLWNLREVPPPTHFTSLPLILFTEYISFSIILVIDTTLHLIVFFYVSKIFA